MKSDGTRLRKALTADEVSKSALKAAVRAGRDALSSGLEARLASLGVFRDGKRIAREAVADQWTAQRVRPGIEAALDRWEQQGFNAGAAVDRFIREASYTWLNRLSAIRALEVRGLIRPIASLDKSHRPSIVALVAEVSPALMQAREVAEELLWEGVFGELALQVGALFDPLDPHGVFPGSSAVLGALQALEAVDEAIWREDDTLGWLYQFFTTKDERATLRKKKGAAFTADDLGPINQFYTPGWVVRFLVDNTLGTLWRRMHPQTTIADFCALMLPATDDDTPLPAKRARDLRIIDPACGAMHFGVYAFDVLRKMYDEEGLERALDVPRLILERNLAGIDIDRRAIQIAALNLYLKAALALRDLGETEPPRNLHLNLGCADAAPPSGEQQSKLRAQISDPALGKAVEVALSSLKYLHAVGSLLDIEADVRTALSKKVKSSPEGAVPLPGLLAQVGSQSDSEPTTLDALVLRAREVAETALRSDDVAGALLAEDALLAAKVLQLVNQRYDVVLMNPPYGELMPPATKEYLQRRYPQSKSDIYGAFFELAFRLAEGGGAVGALTSKTFLYLDTFKHVRKLLLETGRVRALIDAGTGILFESFVAVGATVAWVSPPSVASQALALRMVHAKNPEDDSCILINRLRIDKSVDDVTLYRAMLADLRRLPTETISYWAPPALLAAYEKYPPLEPTYGEVRQGLATGDDERFLRYWWEVPEEQIGQGKRWVPFAKGGDYSPFYESLLRVIDWKDDGAAIKASSASRPQNQQYYFREGITYPRIADRFHARASPAGSIFADKGPSIFSNERFALLGFLNSRVAQALLMAQSVTRQFEVGQLRRLCVPPLHSELGKQLEAIARKAVAVAEAYAEGDELDRRFSVSWLERETVTTLAAAAQRAASAREAFLIEIMQSQKASTELLSEEMGFGADDWAQIERTFGTEIRRDERARIGRAIDPLSLPDEHAKRFISSMILSILRQNHMMESSLLQGRIAHELALHFRDGDPFVEFGTLIGKALSGWIDADFHLYQFRLRNKRPHLVRLSGPRDTLVLFCDALRTTAGDLRNVIANVIEPTVRLAEAAAADGSKGAHLLANQRTIEDAEFLRNMLSQAADEWDNLSDDIRPRIDLLRPAALYLTAGKA